MRSLLVIAICFLITSCVQSKHSKTITFKIQVKDVKNPEQIGLKGNFTKNPWEDKISLTDDDRNEIYETTVSHLTASNQIEFKFIIQDSIYELKNSNNRVIEFQYKPEHIIYETVFDNRNAKIYLIE